MMYIGEELKKRMNILKMDSKRLMEESLVDEDYIHSLLNNEIPLNSIDEFYLNLISNALHCKIEYFIDENVRRKDLLISSNNRGKENNKSVEVKAKLQDFINDFSFLQSVKSGEI